MDRLKAYLSIPLALAGSLWLTTASAESTAAQSPVGYWKMMDESTGKARTIIKIWETPNKTLQGKVVKVFSENIPFNELNNKQPSVGMVILSGLRASHNHWGDGKIYNPENGKTYECYARVADNGKRLDVKGYVGIPILGRSQTWERVDLMSGRVR